MKITFVGGGFSPNDRTKLEKLLVENGFDKIIWTDEFKSIKESEFVVFLREMPENEQNPIAGTVIAPYRQSASKDVFTYSVDDNEADIVAKNIRKDIVTKFEVVLTANIGRVCLASERVLNVDSSLAVIAALCLNGKTLGESIDIVNEFSKW